MTEQTQQPTQHPVLVCAATIESALKDVADVQPVFMSVEDKKAALLALTRLVGQVSELRGRVLVAAEDVAEAEGMRDPAAWLAHHARLDRGEARRVQWLGRAVDERYAGIGIAVREGEVSIGQAEVIVHALDDLPAGLDQEVRAAAEAQLVESAGQFEPRRLRVLGRKVLDVVAPAVAEAAEGEALDREDRAAGRKTFLSFRRNGDGTTDLRGRISDALAMRLQSYLAAFTSPRRRSADSPEPNPGPGGPDSGSPSMQGPAQDRRTYPERVGAAFGSFLEAVDPARLPLHGGDATTVLVTIDLDTLRDQLGKAGVALVGDEPISAAQARRLACMASIVPVVLGGDSQVLDLGRTRRLFSPAQRKAIALRYPTCAAQGCNVPAAACEVHHVNNPWARGGKTDLADGVPLCSSDHHRAHDQRYDTTRHPDGSIRFTRRT